MPGNNTKWVVHYWAGLHGGLGHLYSPGDQRGPYPHLPYALDNGMFGAWSKDRPWDEDAFMDLLNWAATRRQQPLWVVAPDQPMDGDATLVRWSYWQPIIKERGFLVAMAVQQGIDPETIFAMDEAEQPDVIFIGGDDEYKWGSMPKWAACFPWVHVGRVNSPAKLWLCKHHRIASVDGTGWFRGDMEQLAGLEDFLASQKHTGRDEAIRIARMLGGTSNRCKQQDLFDAAA